jgi:hypothetical protein
MNFASMIDHTGKYLQSAPIRVRMAGFESTTSALQANDWQVSVEHFAMWDRANTRLRVAFKHDGIKQVAMGIMDLDDRWLTNAAKEPAHFLNWFKEIGIQINYIAPMIRVLEMPWAGPVGNWTAIDARPAIAQAKDLRDFAMFKPIKGEDFEIYINEKDEAEILELLLKKQDPKQKEIRQREKRRQYEQGDEALLIEDGLMKDRINADVKHQIVLLGAA